MSPKIDEKKKIGESSSYTLLGAYLTFALGIFNTFIIARIIEPAQWGFLILSLSFIFFLTYLCNFFPPNARDQIKYYIPHVTSEGFDEFNKRRKFIFHVLKIQLFYSSIIYLSFLIFVLLIFQGDKLLTQLLFILSPMILFNIIKNLNESILLAFQKFKLVFVIKILNPLIYTINNIYIFTFQLKNPLPLIAFSYLLGSLISSVLSIVLIIPKIPKYIKVVETEFDYKKAFYKLHKTYGVNLLLSDTFIQLTALIINFLFYIYGLPEYITYLTICTIALTSAFSFSSSETDSYVSIFSEINYEKDPISFKTSFYQLVKFLMLFICIIISIMLFFIQIYIILIYSDRYLIIVLIIQIYLFSAFSGLIVRNLNIITQSVNKTNINLIINFIDMIAIITLTIIALEFLNFTVLIFLYVINSFIIAYIMLRLINKSTNLNLNILKFYIAFFIFFISFLIALPFTFLVNFEFFSKNLILNLFINSLIQFIIFIIVFYTIFYITKFLTKEEFNQLVEIIPILRSQKKIIKKIVRFTEKILPSK
ncbi:MAG: hypothetical protein ACFFAN_00485 [Promethearchaeota archaeon]